jgi:hypothetical protein
VVSTLGKPAKYNNNNFSGGCGGGGFSIYRPLI